MGMIKERIRTEEQNKRHRALVEENRQRKLKKYQERRPEKNRLVSFGCFFCISERKRIKHLFL